MQTNLLPTSQGGQAAATPSITANAADNPSDLFTKLLVAQIKNQDPLEPTDPSQFVNQLTQLSQMESLQKLASQNATNAALLQSLQAVQLGAQVGSNVSVRSDTVQIGGKPVQGRFTLQNANAEVTLVLTGADGRQHRMPLGSRASGDVSFTIDPATPGLLPGSYAMRVETDSKESPSVEVLGAISSVKLSAAGKLMLDVANVGEVSPDMVAQYNGRPAITSN